MSEGGLGHRVSIILERTNLLACIQCGRCTATCPAALPSRLRAREVVRAVSDGDLSIITDTDDLWHCTTCFSCQERCPKGVLLTQAILWLRGEAVALGRYPAAHPTALAEIARTGNTFPLDAEVRAVRGQLSLPLDPPDCAHDEEELEAFHRLLDVLGFEELAPKRRPYPGERETDDDEGGGEA